MSTFQFIIIVLAIVYVFSFLYFSISGRILNKKRENKDDERYEEQHSVEEQITVLTQRLGAITAENDRLNGVVRSWMAQANDYKVRLDTALKEEWEKEANDLQEQLKKVLIEKEKWQKEANDLQEQLKKENQKKGDE